MNCVFIVPYFATNDKTLITNVKNDKLHVEKIQERHFPENKQNNAKIIAGGRHWGGGV